MARCQAVVKTLGERYTVLADRFGTLSERLSEDRFQLAVLGQFKRGKSTLLNALLGEALLPTAVVPATAVRTFIRYGPALGTTVAFQNNGKPRERTFTDLTELNGELTRLVTEQGNPENRLGVSQVTVTCDAAILERGVVLIDTPGVGSTLHHNTEAALESLPHCDAALFVVSPDPPLTEVEVEFLQRVIEKVPRLFFVLNKVDQLSPTDRQAALGFLRQTLKERVGLPNDTPLFCVSSRLALEAGTETSPGLRERSGLADLERHLVDFLTHGKSEVLRDAINMKAADAVAEALMELQLELASFRLPVQELERRSEALEQTLRDVKRQRQAIGDQLEGECRRTHELLEDHARRIRVIALERMMGVVQRAVDDGPGAVTEHALQSAVAGAIPECFELLSAETTELLCTQLTRALRPHQEAVDKLIEEVCRTAAELFDLPYRAPASDRAFEMVRQPYWVTQEFRSTLNPIPTSVVDGLLPQRMRRRRVLNRVTAEIESLVLHNLENLRWAAYQNIDRTFRRFGSALDERLDQVEAGTHGAIGRTIERRRSEKEAVANEIARLEVAVTELTRLQRDLTQTPG